MNQLEAAAITLSGLLQSVHDLNEESPDGLYQMLKQSIGLQADRLETIREVYDQRCRAKRDHAQRLAEAAEGGVA